MVEKVFTKNVPGVKPRHVGVVVQTAVERKGSQGIKRGRRLRGKGGEGTERRSR